MHLRNRTFHVENKGRIHDSLRPMGAAIVKNDIGTCGLKAAAGWLIKFRKSVSYTSLNLGPRQRDLALSIIECIVTGPQGCTLGNRVKKKHFKVLYYFLICLLVRLRSSQ